MFKVKDKWELSVLEKYGFVESSYFYTLRVNLNTVYQIHKETKKISIVSRNLSITNDMLAFYKLIKDDIIEEVTE